MTVSNPNESRRTFALTAVNLAAALVAAFALLTGGQRAATLGLTRHGQTLTAQDAGAPDAVAVVAVAPGTAGQVYTISDAGLPHWAAAAASSGVTVTTSYASDGTAANGAGGDATASVTGSGSSSTVTFSVAGTARQITSSAIAAGSWVSPSIPQTARRVILYVRSTAATSSTNGWRYLQMSMRRAGESPPASMLLGVSANDANAYYGLNNRAGSTTAGYNFGSLANSSPLTGTDRWLRVTWEIEGGGPRVRFAAGSTTGSTRPTLWTPLNVDSQTQPTSRTDLGSLGTGAAQLIVGLESFGGGISVSSLTISLTMEVET